MLCNISTHPAFSQTLIIDSQARNNPYRARSTYLGGAATAAHGGGLEGGNSRRTRRRCHPLPGSFCGARHRHGSQGRAAVHAHPFAVNPILDSPYPTSLHHGRGPQHRRHHHKCFVDSRRTQLTESPYEPLATRVGDVMFVSHCLK